MLCRNQIVMTPGKEGYHIDISVPAIKDAMDARGVQDQWNCMSKVRNLFFAMRAKDENS